jgi:vitamin B12 transporter
MHLPSGRSGLVLCSPSSKLNTYLRSLAAATILLLSASLAFAGVIRGTVTDPSGATVRGATIVLMNGSKLVSTTQSVADGSFQFTTGQAGHFALVITAPGFRQLEVPSFYASRTDSVERNLVMEVQYERQSIVVTATGTPTPQEQTSEATTVLASVDLGQQPDFTGGLRLIPGTAVFQTGERGAQTSLFVRGGPSDANLISLDGVNIGDLGGRFDFGPQSTFGIASTEVFRGANSSLYGADASSGIVALSTVRGTTNNPNLRLAGDLGNFYASQERAELAGARNKLDYYSGFSWFQTSNSLPNSAFHVATTTGNFGYHPITNIEVRGTIHYGVDATGVPNAWQFYQVAADSKEGDQDLFISGALEYQTTLDFHNVVTYGATRKREQLHTFSPAGQLIQYNSDFGLSAYFGKSVTFTGANGYTASGRAMLSFPGTYPSRTDLVSNRDQLVYQGDYRFTPHLIGLIGFRYEDERGSEPGSTYYVPVKRTNYDYNAAVHGDFKNRFFYNLGGSLEHYSLFGTQTNPRAGVSFFVIKPRHGLFNGTRILFNFGDAVREPALTDQDDSLYTFLLNNGGQSTIDQLKIRPIGAPTTRSYEAGLEQGFLANHITFRVNYFHNQFGKQIEYVGLNLIPELLPNLSPAQQQELETLLQNNFAYELTINSEAYKAQGIEATVEAGIGHGLFFRGGYTYLDAVIQRSFTNDDEDLLGPVPIIDGLPVGPYSPLKGARPFRRPPHVGYVSASYAGKKWTLVSTNSFYSRSDDSTYLEGEDLSGGNSLLLPNRNLDHGFAKMDLSGSFQIFSRVGIYATTENLLSNQHIAPIGYLSLPFNFRAGIRLRLGKGTGL